MGLIVLGHGQDWDHGNASLLASLPPCSFINGGKIRVHISRVTAASGHFFPRCGHFTERVCIVRDICQDNKHVHILFKRKVLCRCQRHLRRCDTLDGRIVCKIDEQDGTVESSCLAETLYEKVGFLKCDTHCCKYNGEVLILSKHLCLSSDLCGKLCMGKTGCREDRQFLTANQCVQSVDSGHAGLDKLFRIASGRRVHGQTVDIHARFRQDLRSIVNRTTQTVENAAQHIL